MAELGMEEERARVARDAEKAKRQSILYSQLNVARSSANILSSKKTELQEKIQRITTALSAIEQAKEELTNGKSQLNDVTIESGSWKGENAQKAESELSEMKTSAETISKKAEDVLADVQEDKQKLERELETVEADLTGQNARIMGWVVLKRVT